MITSSIGPGFMQYIGNMSDDLDEDIMPCGANTELQLLRACSLVGESRSNAAIFDM